MAGAKTIQRSTYYYKDYPDADAVYELWLSAMNRNMGNTDFHAPFDGIMLQLNEGYLREIKDTVTRYIDDPNEDRRLWHVYLSQLVYDPIRNFYAIDECVFATLRMLDANVTEDLVPSPVGMNKALYFEGLYGNVWPEIRDIFERLSSKQYLYTKSAYLNDVDVRIKTISGTWPVPEGYDRKGLTWQALASEEMVADE